MPIFPGQITAGCPGCEQAGLECANPQGWYWIDQGDGESRNRSNRAFINLRVRYGSIFSGAHQNIYPRRHLPSPSHPPLRRRPSRPTTFAMNVSTVLPVDGWAGYAAEAHKYLPPPSRLALLCLINVPLLAVVLNVLRQLVCPSQLYTVESVPGWLNRARFVSD